MRYLLKTLMLSTLFILFSCNGNDSYFQQITKTKSFNDRVLELNKSLTEIRKSEKKSALVKEDEDYLEFEYKIGESESYKISYFFDAAGCYEVGFDSYFLSEETAKEILIEIKGVFVNDSNFGSPSNSNQLYEWRSKDGLISVELDYANQDKGLISLTIFANQ